MSREFLLTMTETNKHSSCNQGCVSLFIFLAALKVQWSKFEAILEMISFSVHWHFPPGHQLALGNIVGLWNTGQGTEVPLCDAIINLPCSMKCTLLLPLRVFPAASTFYALINNFVVLFRCSRSRALHLNAAQTLRTPRRPPARECELINDIFLINSLSFSCPPTHIHTQNLTHTTHRAAHPTSIE